MFFLSEFNRTRGAKDKQKRKSNHTALKIGSGLVAAGLIGTAFRRKKAIIQPIQSKVVETADHLGLVVPNHVVEKHLNKTHISGHDVHELISNASYLKASHPDEISKIESTMNKHQYNPSGKHSEQYIKIQLHNNESGKANQLPYFMNQKIDRNKQYQIHSIESLRNLDGLDKFTRV